MAESELYKSLGELTRNKERWEESIPYVASLLPCESVKIQAKALWLIGEMGLSFPSAIEEYIPAIVSFLDREEAILRERAVIALGRIGRGSFQSIEPYWTDLFRFEYNRAPGVRLAFIWASENIATNTPDPYRGHMPVFGRLLYDEDDKVRMEAPRRNRPQSRGPDSLSGSNQGSNRDEKATTCFLTRIFKHRNFAPSTKTIIQWK